jgi:hypothetical protein
LVRNKLLAVLDLRIVEISSNQALGGVESVERIGDHLWSTKKKQKKGVSLCSQCGRLNRLSFKQQTWRLAAVPIKMVPSSWNATEEGVVREPSAFSNTRGF